MRQNPSESVSNFAHRFLETQNSLEKLIPGIHSSSDGNQMELVHAFSMKLRPELAKSLISRDQPFQDLLAAIDCAKRHEAMMVPDSSSMPAEVLYSAPGRSSSHKSTNFHGRTTSAICRNFNRFSPSRCELPNNVCKNGYLHECSVCHTSQCKALHHRIPPTPQFQKFSHNKAHTQGRFSRGNPSPSSDTRAKRNGNSTPSSNVSVNVAEPLDSVKNLITESFASLRSELTTSIMDEVEKRLPAPPSHPVPSGSSAQDPLFGMPAVTPSAPFSSVSALDLAHRNILWTSITSCGVSLPLPLDSCCSVSLVSQNHAELVAKASPTLLFTKLEQPIPVSVAGPSSDLRAVGTMQVPIVWENGRLTTFTMLVVPQLSWPILFGQNHLRQTDAHIYSKALKVPFADPSMNFTVTCYDSSPLSAFPTIRPRGAPQASAANVTCLLTPMPSFSSSIAHEGKLQFSQGFTVLTVCLLITGSLLSSPLLSGPLWLEGTTFSPGLHVLSGPFNLQSIQQFSPTGDFLCSLYSTPSLFSSSDKHSFSVSSSNLLCHAVFLSTGSPSSTDDIASGRLFTTNILIHSDKGTAYLPHDMAFGSIRSQTPDDLLTYKDASTYTAHHLAESWHSCLLSDGPLSFPGAFDPVVTMPTDVSMTNSSRILSPFLDQQHSDMTVQDNSFPPTQDYSITSSSLALLPLLVDSLGLDTPASAYAPDISSDHLRPSEDLVVEPLQPLPSQPSHSDALPDLSSLAKEFGKYLTSLPSKSAISSQACKYIYDRFPEAQHLLATHGRLRGLVNAFPYLQLDGGIHGGTYILSVNSELFEKLI